jgi:hypothetical protein
MQETLEKLRTFPPRLLAAIDGIAETDLRRPESDGRWSIADVVAHLGDLELIYAVRIRTILAGATVTLPALAQDAWVHKVHRGEPLSELVEQFSFHRRMNITLGERLDEEELSRSGTHPDYGALTVRDAFGRMDRHEEKHLAQIERIKSAQRQK